MIFIKEFNPTKIKKCDISASRKRFKNNKNNNVKFLLEKRFNWMMSYIAGKKNIIELGSGNGSSREMLKNKKIILTDIQKYSWISKRVDMNDLKLEKKYIKNVDVFILNQALHHCANPAKLLKKMLFYLRKNGLILIREPEISFFLRFFLYILDDEAWSFKVNVFNSKKNIFNPSSPSDANNATATLLFKDEEKFCSHFPQFNIEKNELSEFLIFLNSGGVFQEKFYIPINRFFFNFLFFIDKILIFLLPGVFALARTVVLKKK